MIMKQEMKTIKNPSAGTISLLLIPIAIIFTIRAFFGYYAQWLLIVGGIFLAIYTTLITYFCVRQKCYAQLARILLIVIFMVLIIFI